MLNEKFIIKIDGKSYVTYEGLLDLAHSMGLMSIEVELIQIPNKDNNMVAICQARAATKDQLYVDLGDASPNSVKSNFAPHIIRMASTRAKARALRDLTNVGMTAIEELSMEDSITTKEDTSQYKFQKPSAGQLETLKKLSKNSKTDIDYSSLTRESAGNLIKELQK